ncbi:MAG TPA: nucleoside deaminase [Casimicrobiaceae bacterium]|nr:nucleoside deaminase [Casimicrobiaceae bacterium]
MTLKHHHLALAIRLARENVLERGGRPFGAVLVKDGEVLATGVNEMLATHDPSAHAEMQAIRAAAAKLKTTRLDDCVMFASGHPCPMCLSAMHMTGIAEVYYAYSNEDGEKYGLSTARIYAEMAKPLSLQSIRIEHVPVRDGLEHPFDCWQRMQG